MKNIRSRSGLVVAIGAVVAGLALTAPAAAVAAPASPVKTATMQADGWIRLGHFSPDTKRVDVRVTGLRGGSTLFELEGVGYGDVSAYAPLPKGNYTVSMVPAGSDDWKTPTISATVAVDPETATTVAAYGPNADLQVRAFNDDLGQPTEGNARIRLIQASTITSTVDVMTSTGLPIARQARAGSATAYAEVPGGDWNLELTGRGVNDSVDVSVAAGSVTTLFVLDTADGGLTILPVLDSAAAAVTPDGGVQTGGGGLAHDRSAPRASSGMIAR